MLIACQVISRRLVIKWTGQILPAHRALAAP
jgi:hypothetical protein